MAGNKIGGSKAAETNKQRYGLNYYSTIGKKGGELSKGGGFKDRELASKAGRKGGSISKRKPKDA